MVAPGSQWPPLSGGRESSARNINERILDANYDVRQLLNHISSNSSVKVPRPVLEYLKSVQELTTDLIKNPIGQDWKQQFEQLRQETNQIKQDIHAVRIATATVAGPSTRVRSYVDAVKNAPPPTHFLSSHGSTSTNPASPSDLLQDRQVIVKLGDSDGVKRFRTQTPAEITRTAEKARVKAAKEVDGLTMASAKFVAARQLKSGDLSLSLRTAKEAEIIRCHRQVWVKHLWKGSEVRLPSWGVVIHDVNVRSLGTNTAAGIGDQGRKQGIIKQLLTENLFNWGDKAGITQISWLVLPEGKKSGSLIVEFTSPHTANNAIDTGALWDSDVLTTVLYDRAARIRQCHNCQKYGHIGNTCSNETKCVFCAEKHHSRDCQRKKDATLSERKCANCGGAHNGWSKRCPDFIREIERVQALAQARERHHRVPAYLSIKDTGPGTLASTTTGEGDLGGSGSGVSTAEDGPQSSSRLSTGRPLTSRPSTSRLSAKTTNSRKNARSTTSEKESNTADAMEVDSIEVSEDARETQSRDKQQGRIHQDTALQTQRSPDFTAGRASKIGDSLRQSIYAPKEVRSEPPRRRAPSRVSTSPSMVTRSKETLSNVLQANEKPRTGLMIPEDEDADPITVIESSSVAARTVSTYQPSILSQVSNNHKRTARTRPQNAPGKENMSIFSYDKPTRTPGPRGRNKRTHDDQVDLTITEPSNPPIH
ncbi:unnamed protein product [Penicillium nalgiovense]|nr:unnamed protein product [Penicillium nalgiovense]